MTDVRNLLPNESMINASAPATFREYNTEQMIMVNAPNSGKVLITKYGEVADGEYLDPRGNQVIHFDHIKQVVTGARAISSGEIEQSIEPLRSAVDKLMAEYSDQHYPNGACTVYGRDGAIHVAISAARFNSSNFWNGRWRVVWSYKDGELTGHYKITIHYYEDGNVQLNTDTTQKVSITETGAPDVVAQAIQKAIAKADQAYQTSLDNSYATMGDTTFKALRRALPITRQKIDWNKIRNYKIGGDVAK